MMMMIIIIIIIIIIAIAIVCEGVATWTCDWPTGARILAGRQTDRAPVLIAGANVNKPPSAMVMCDHDASIMQRASAKSQLAHSRSSQHLMMIIISFLFAIIIIIIIIVSDLRLALCRRL